MVCQTCPARDNPVTKRSRPGEKVGGLGLGRTRLKQVTFCFAGVLTASVELLRIHAGFLYMDVVVTVITLAAQNGWWDGEDLDQRPAIRSNNEVIR